MALNRPSGPIGEAPEIDTIAVHHNEVIKRALRRCASEPCTAFIDPDHEVVGIAARQYSSRFAIAASRVEDQRAASSTDNSIEALELRLAMCRDRTPVTTFLMFAHHREKVTVDRVLITCDGA